MGIYEELQARGLIAQVTDEPEIKELLNSGNARFYIGFDPTADSLHVGHFVQLMAMAHMQRAGHRPIALIGGGTGMIGDPSGRTDLRSVMTGETIAHNCLCFKKQMERFIDFSDGKALVLNNADWLCGLNYIDFLRSVGTHFSVLEFNYMLMQAYDFLVLNENYGCQLQLGGDDQWSNMLAGADLIRRKLSKPAFAMTFSLLTTSEGTKMGKTAKGAVWLDENKTPPYDFYQYWRNVDDADVEKCLKLLTFLPVAEIEEMCRFKDQRINDAKVRLAYELTKIVHGADAADKARAQAEAAFSDDAGNMPCKEIPFSANIIDVLTLSEVAKSRGDARRLIDGGGVSVNELKITDYGDLPSEITEKREFVLHKGKKVHLRIVLK